MRARELVDHERLVRSIYDAAEDPRGFGDVLGDIARVLDSPHAHTLVIDGGGLLADTHCHGYDPSGFDEYDRWRDQDPRFAAARVQPGKVLSDVEVVEPAVFERSAIYNEFLSRVGGVRYTLFANVAAAPDLTVAQAFLRRKGAAPFQRDEAKLLAVLLPHLARAVRLRHLVRSLRNDVDDLRRALDAIVTPLAILDRGGGVRCANGVAEALLATGDGVLTERGVLSARRADEARALSAAIASTTALADASSYRPPPAHHVRAVAITRARGRPLFVVLYPLRPRSAVRRDDVRDARALAVFHDPDRLIALDASLVARLHGLTPTEAALAVALAEGGTLGEFAAARGCSEQTARTHLKRVLDKTGTQRQADLVRVLLTSTAVHQLP